MFVFNASLSIFYLKYKFARRVVLWSEMNHPATFHTIFDIILQFHPPPPSPNVVVDKRFY